MDHNGQRVKPLAERELTQDPARLRWHRHKAALTIPELAKKTGVSKATISLLERGRRPASVITLRTLAEVLDCKVVDLLAPEPEPSRRIAEPKARRSAA